MTKGKDTGGSSSVELRRAVAGDLDAIVELFIAVNRALAPEHLKQAFEDYIDLSLETEIRQFTRYYDPAVGNGLWVATVDGEIAGMYGLERVSFDDVELRRMYVAPSRRRSGLARRMLRDAERQAADMGYRRIVLSTAELQEAAIALYRASGYRFVRKEEAQESSNKTIGGGIARLHFEKDVPPAD